MCVEDIDMVGVAGRDGGKLCDVTLRVYEGSHRVIRAVRVIRLLVHCFAAFRCVAGCRCRLVTWK